MNHRAESNIPAERLAQRLNSLKVREEEFEEAFIRSRGHGGQNVNKTSTAVVLVHRPTGLRVRSEAERSQAQNRLQAWDLLLDKIERQQRAAIERQRAEREKLRRQKRQRSPAARERLLQDKARRSARKQLRGRVTED